MADREAVNVMRNTPLQNQSEGKRRGIDLPWNGPPRVRRKKLAKAEEKQPQLSLAFARSPEANAVEV